MHTCVSVLLSRVMPRMSSCRAATRSRPCGRERTGSSKGQTTQEQDQAEEGDGPVERSQRGSHQQLETRGQKTPHRAGRWTTAEGGSNAGSDECVLQRGLVRGICPFPWGMGDHGSASVGFCGLVGLRGDCGEWREGKGEEGGEAVGLARLVLALWEKLAWIQDRPDRPVSAQGPAWGPLVSSPFCPLFLGLTCLPWPALTCPDKASIQRSKSPNSADLTLQLPERATASSSALPRMASLPPPTPHRPPPSISQTPTTTRQRRH